MIGSYRSAMSVFVSTYLLFAQCGWSSPLPWKSSLCLFSQGGPGRTFFVAHPKLHATRTGSRGLKACIPFPRKFKLVYPLDPHAKAVCLLQTQEELPKPDASHQKQELRGPADWPLDPLHLHALPVSLGQIEVELLDVLEVEVGGAVVVQTDGWVASRGIGVVRVATRGDARGQEDGRHGRVCRRNVASWLMT